MTAKKTAAADEQTVNREPTGPVTPPVDAEPTTPPETPEPPASTEPGEAPDPPAQPKPIDEEKATAVAYRYHGPGAVAGVPPRDLTRLDVERLIPEQLRDVRLAAPGGKPIYEAV